MYPDRSKSKWERFFALCRSMSTADAWLVRSVDGFCAPTSASRHPRACSMDASGSFPLSKPQVAGGWLSAVDACLHLCRTCANCRYVSISVKHADCSWFRSCAMPSLRTDISTFRTAALASADDGQGVESHHLWQRGAGVSMARQMDGAADALDNLQLGRPLPLEPALRYPLAKSPRPMLLLGLISGNVDRRELFRCTWVGALPESVRVRFVLGRGQPDRHASDVLLVPVDEDIDITSTAGRARGRTRPHRSGAQTWTCQSTGTA